jgi:hypothetical protein
MLMKTLIRGFMIGALLIADLLVFFYSTTFVMSYLYELDSAPITF